MARVKHLRGRHGEYDYLDPGVGGDRFRQGYDWKRYIDLVGHKESQLLDQSKRSYRTKWLDPYASDNRKFWGDNFARHRYNFSDYSPGDRQHFTGAQRRKWEDDQNEFTYHSWKQAGTEHEILDWDAYSRDALYAEALQKRRGHRQFKTLQDIWDAEDVMSGRWSAPKPAPAPAPKAKAPSVPRHVDIEKQLKALGIEHEKAIGGWRDQLAEQKATSSRELERFITDFHKQQQAYQTQAERERADLESQLNLSFAQKFDTQQRDLTSKYEGLLSQARTDAEAARIKQAQEFEQRRLDQEAGWQAQEQAWEKKDSVYQSQLGELKSSLGVQRDLYSGLQGKFGDLQGELGEQKGLYSGLQDQFGQAREDWSRQQQGLETSLAESQRQAETLGAAVKRNEELAMRNAERARVSASYGSQGKPMNQPVQGVRTLNELTPTKKQQQFGTRGTFGRSGLRISNLNI